jgi:hypothetical protein
MEIETKNYVNNTNDESFDINELNIIRDKIESMTKFNQVGVLRILQKNGTVILNENKYGIHINLTELPISVIQDLKIYINYVKTQEQNLDKIELQKEVFKNIYFTKDNKDNTGKIVR